MHANQQDAICGGPLRAVELALGTVNEFGDVVCPHCRVNIITPSGKKLVCGVALCLRCRKSFEVTKDIADEAEIIYQTRTLRRRSNVGPN